MIDGAATSQNTHFTLTTPTVPGAIALIQLHGSQCSNVLRALTGIAQWQANAVRLVNFDGIDEGLACQFGKDHALLMPHGGPRVVQRLLSRLSTLGVQSMPNPVEHVLYPEAADAYEALTLATLARAVSPLAIEPLLAQPAIWREVKGITETDRARSVTLKHLLTPPLIVVAGAANVGKSTLSNALIGRSVSIALDMPGTTRDYTIAQVDLGGLVAFWHDTPGLRETDDLIEAKAIEIAENLIERADLLIALSDAEHDWPLLPRAPDLRVANKMDIARRTDADVNISAMSGEGVSSLVHAIRDTLLPPEELKLACRRPWLFDEKRLMEIRKYAAGKDLPGLVS